MATSCAIAMAFANNTDYMWSAFDYIGGVQITVKLNAVDSQDNFECLPTQSGIGSVCSQYRVINISSAAFATVPKV